MSKLLNPTAKETLKLIGLGSLVIASFAAPGLPLAFNFVSKEWKKYKRKELGRIIKRFTEQEVVSFREENGKQVIGLTEKGRSRLLSYDFENLQLKSKRRDGLFRVLVFDIPENKKKNRELFRQKLKELGFIRMQDSVFVSAFPCKDEIDFICNYLGISRHVTLFSIRKIERGEELIFKKSHMKA
ncbi:CRISPR-associated endonuclease Cas2 [Candidatus Daviesbacteria bacterium]|nr:CRISPR-associated endonuclease Cas2 [Candidatus Daviesbacteria bacterium]